MSKPLHFNTSAFELSIAELVKKHSIAVENLTKEQTADAIKQAILSGDFQRNIVQGSDAQSVIYIPFLEVERLRTENKAMLEMLRKISAAIAELDERV